MMIDEMWAGCSGRMVKGFICDSKKNRDEAIHMEIAGSVALKRMRWSVRFLLQREMIRPSRATINVPGAVPNRSTAVNTNVSETEMVAGIEGTLTVRVPLKTVSAAKMSQASLTGRV
jgi:hypothetical protein